MKPTLTFLTALLLVSTAVIVLAASAGAAEPQPPLAAREAGLTRSVFSEDFTDIEKAIDLQDTGKTGFSF